MATSIALVASAPLAARPHAQLGWRVIATGSSHYAGVHVDSGLSWRLRPHAFALRLITNPSRQELLGGFGVDCRRGRVVRSRQLDLRGYTPRTVMMPMPMSNPARCYASAYVSKGLRTESVAITVQLLMR